MTEPTVFTRIVRGEIPADVVFENERILAIRDIAPKAPVHLLIFPKTPEYANVAELAAGDPELLAEMAVVAQTLADAHSNGQFRLVFNSGEEAGQTVFHVHAHVLGGHLTEGSLATG
ncbi:MULTISPECIES: histidine triad nucleotide-binding protein [unclassified Rathayibacter]|uniref:histidine triad nucleotide-binding protein n=1 Tax=unclassified Rathayibacter TaxID=2609250 RepID=UPI000F4C0DBD|nr:MULTISPECIES: histidine triad nucleotide-binding protein [unclassified Rathayibacter]MCJ1673072.1 histidine triad nucleotide-binding protein [Rathayibacter sp. VKM Ac-2929]MCJ1682568.1 histidine triad nucleotide-binding protein [Rathayibacter sp. VKM Ac-2928]MCJ1685500.1 histidine triad nucleotide-binding protein [Rathayibacter sp. VKM Ac-2927]MCJ1703612.1 histidine triad nucleotide-binding protein [Rathayibacter sp. VKM Ac-2926]ROP57892.1 histidine triad (HIT) family protein [Rathayibacter